MACEEERPPLLTNLWRKSATCEGLENRESASACACEIRTRAAPVQNRDDTAVVPPVADTKSSLLLDFGRGAQASRL